MIEHELPHELTDAKRLRRYALAVLAVLAVGAVVLLLVFHDPYESASCKGVGISQAPLGGPMPDGAPTSEAAVRAFVAHGAFNMGRPFPTDGWKPHGSAWVSDVDGGFYRVHLVETGTGWYVASLALCVH